MTDEWSGLGPQAWKGILGGYRRRCCGPAGVSGGGRWQPALWTEPRPLAWPSGALGLVPGSRPPPDKQVVVRGRQGTEAWSLCRGEGTARWLAACPQGGPNVLGSVTGAGEALAANGNCRRKARFPSRRVPG